MSGLWQDLRRVARSLVRSPGFTFVVVFTLALGTGATTAIYSVVEAVLLRPFPYAEPDRLVLVWNHMEGSAIQRAPVAPPDLVDYREQASLFAGFAATRNSGGRAASPPTSTPGGRFVPTWPRVLATRPGCGSSPG